MQNLYSIELAEEYGRKLLTPQGAAQIIKSGDWVDFGIGNNKPVDVVEALAHRKDELFDVKFRSVLTVPPLPPVATVDDEGNNFVWHSWHFAGFERKKAYRGPVWFIPMVYHELPRMVRDFNDIDVAMLHVTPMNEDGYFNFGTSISHSKALCDKAHTVIVEVNQNMPRVIGQGQEHVHISEVDWIIEGCNHPLAELPIPVPTPNDIRIADYVVEEIEDGACIQLGIGGLALYIGHQIAGAGFKDLGVHTEFLTEAYYEMYEAGCLTCRKKEINTGKMVYTLAMGTRRLYDFMHENPLVLGCPVDYTNDPRVICQNSKVVSVNNFLEVDLTGQVCSESVGPRQITGTGGQLDFVQGAFDSPGGKSFLCMPSTYTTRDGQVVSRITHQLTPGSIVTVPRPLAHYIVTEFGKTCLKGKSTWQRAESLISIAHPDFRDQLIKEAEILRIWRPSNKIV